MTTRKLKQMLVQFTGGKELKVCL